jgi:hypothetical protein
MPPRELFDSAESFLPAPEVSIWIEDAFLDDESPLFHEEHLHLRGAHIGVLWTTFENSRKGIPVAGDASIPHPHPSLGKWERALYNWQMKQWFGPRLPDFLIRLYAPYASACENVDFCALVKHELCHMAQATDEFGAPRFNRETGRPVYTMIGHDVEQFISVVRDFGPVGRNVKALADAARRKPRIARAALDWACGNCLARAA